MDWLTQLIDKLFSIFPRLWCVEPDEGGVRITLGKHTRTIGPGWYVYWPIIHVIRTIEVTPQVKDIRIQSVRTQDGQDICVGLAVMYRIKDAGKAILKVQDYDSSLQALILGIVTEYINGRTLADCSDITAIRDTVLKGIKDDTAGWGLNIMRAYITDLGVAKNLRLLLDKPIITVIGGKTDG